MVGWLSGFRAQTGYVACDVIRCLGEAAAPGRGLRAVPRLCIEYPGICLTTEENHVSAYPAGQYTPLIVHFNDVTIPPSITSPPPLRHPLRDVTHPTLSRVRRDRIISVTVLAAILCPGFCSKSARTPQQKGYVNFFKSLPEVRTASVVGSRTVG